MLRVMVVVAMLQAPAPTQGRTCPAPVVPDAAAAHRIAQTAIDAIPTKETRKYELIVEPGRDRPDHWIAYQRSSDDRLGGGGMSMRIDRCSGKVSALHRQR